MTLRIILADDHPIVRSGVRALLERNNLHVVAEAGSTDELVAALETHECDVLLTDFSMPGGQLADGLAMLEHLRGRWPKLPIIVLTMMNNPGVLSSILATGVRGLLNKSDALSELPLAIQAVSHGRDYVSASGGHQLEQMEGHDSARLPLSPREAEVLGLFVSGLTVSQIAEQLDRSIKTVSRQKMDGMSKLGLKTDLEVYAYAREHGLLT
ncbi:response regulator [Lysobacter sp. GCM10012299]|uniref:response regulator n=1 Tax=Lysobacter sp. GCM10012299 TaxID=3317333 RepID=UPI00360882BD